MFRVKWLPTAQLARLTRTPLAEKLNNPNDIVANDSRLHGAMRISAGIVRCNADAVSAGRRNLASGRSGIAQSWKTAPAQRVRGDDV